MEVRGNNLNKSIFSNYNIFYLTVFVKFKVSIRHTHTYIYTQADAERCKICMRMVQAHKEPSLSR